ncbi:anti-sigma factor family protein [Aestuariispira insulae]|uniref:Anti-sigma factor RsiW n=1 Tax=Aestuariispira insulae TaxID=1461337 RepID=A0A3D9HRM3_9PROT|nr:hypothetical protein [Aestuariispira insulae]RED52142.1 hypothetical protein DFP90_102160 [Aestuariispira insulae]
MMAPGKNNDEQPNMAAVSEQDWILLNGYADDALSVEDRLQIDQRLARDPAFSEALAKILASKAKMRALYVGDQYQPAADPVRKTTRTAAGQQRFHKVALAAGLAALIAGAAILSPEQIETGPIALADGLHETFMQRGYTPFAAGLKNAARPSDPALPTAPDLTFAGLALVDHLYETVGQKTRIGFHYRGRNGCSLTVFLYRTEAATAWPEAEDPDLTRTLWQESGYLIATLSKGMADDKFRDASRAVRQSLSQWFRRDDNLIAQLPVQDYPPCA